MAISLPVAPTWGLSGSSAGPAEATQRLVESLISSGSRYIRVGRIVASEEYCTAMRALLLAQGVCVDPVRWLSDERGGTAPDALARRPPG
jgi:hypothetical protein